MSTAEARRCQPEVRLYYAPTLNLTFFTLKFFTLKNKKKTIKFSKHQLTDFVNQMQQMLQINNILSLRCHKESDTADWVTNPFTLGTQNL